MATITYTGNIYTLDNTLLSVEINDKTVANKAITIKQMFVSGQKVSGSSYDLLQIRLTGGDIIEELQPKNLNTWDVVYGTIGTTVYVEAILNTPYAVVTHNATITTIVIRWELRDGEKFIRQSYRIETDKILYIHITNYIYTTFAGATVNPIKFVGKRKSAIDRCESVTGWSPSASLSTTLDNTIFAEGAGAIKIVGAINSINQEVVTTFATTNMQESKIVVFWVRGGDSTNIEDAFKFFVDDIVGGKQYSRTLNLKQYYVLNGGKTAHNLISEWRLVVIDISSMIRANVTSVGIQSNTNIAFTMYVDDIWRWDIVTENVITSGVRSFNIIRDPAGELITQDLTYYPFFSVLDGPIGGFVYVNSIIGVWNQTSLLQETGDSSSISKPTTGIRQIMKDVKENGLTITSDSYFVGLRNTSETSCWADIVAINSTLNDVIEVSTTNLKPIYDEGCVIQLHPTSYYDLRQFITDLLINATPFGLLGLSTEVNTYIMPTASIGTIAYRDHDRWWEWNGVMQDNKLDMLRLVINKWKLAEPTKTRRVWAEVTNAVVEGMDSREAFPSSHVATYYTGQLMSQNAWIYTSIDGASSFVVTHQDNDYATSYYDPIIVNGISHTLDSTYPKMTGAFWSCVTTATSWGDGTPTLFDAMRDKVEYLCKYFDVDGIVWSEITILYLRTFSARDLVLYNTWRLNNGLSTLSDFDRVDNLLPVSDSNPYIVDDNNLWMWKTYQTQQAVIILEALCHTYNKKLIMDCNTDNTVAVVDKMAIPWAGQAFAGDFPKYLGHYAERTSTGMDKMIRNCDLIFAWHYFGYITDIAYRRQSVIDFCDFMRPYRGRLYVGIGTYPSATPPTAAEVADAIAIVKAYGYNIIIIGNYFKSDSYWSATKVHLQELPTVTSSVVGDVLTINTGRKGIAFTSTHTEERTNIIFDGIARRVFNIYDKNISYQGDVGMGMAFYPSRFSSLITPWDLSMYRYLFRKQRSSQEIWDTRELKIN